MVTQGANVLRGERLIVDLTTGNSPGSKSGGGRVQGLFSPVEGRQAGPKDKDKEQDPERPRPPNRSRSRASGANGPGSARDPALQPRCINLVRARR